MEDKEMWECNGGPFFSLLSLFWYVMFHISLSFLAGLTSYTLHLLKVYNKGMWHQKIVILLNI